VTSTNSINITTLYSTSHSPICKKEKAYSAEDF
jgi:hypothetical protein